MKNLIILLLAIFAFSSCTKKAVEDSTDKTEIPTSIINKMKVDTVLNCNILETDSKLYVIEKSPDGLYVSKVIDREFNAGRYILLGMVLAIFSVILIAVCITD